IGSGTGSLTARLSEQARAVISVEVDPAFHALACEALADRRNVLLLRADILAGKNELAPEVLRAIAEVQQRSGSARLKLVGNLPYAVATPVVSNFLLSDFCFERMVVMVQSEIAQRLLARPGTKDYGALAVLVQSLADVEAVRRRVPPEVFWPRPRVASAIVCVRPSVKKRTQVGDVVRFRRFLRDLYTRRRKNLRGALSSIPNGRREKVEVDRKLAELGLDGTCRAEELNVEQHLRLCEMF